MEQDKGYLMLPRGVQHMRALGRFGRFTLFHHLSHHPMTLAVFPLCWCLGFLVWVFLFVLSCFVSCFASVMEFLKSSARIRPR